MVNKYQNPCEDGMIPVQICGSKYEQIEKDLHFLSCLENAGVDNWVGYEFAYEAFNEKYPDE